jgi:hypothetical protein
MPHSIKDKIDTLCCIASEKQPELLLATKSWCNHEVTNAFMAPLGCETQPDLQKDRLDTTRCIGGGLLIYVQSGVTVLTINKSLDIVQFCSFRILKRSGDVTLDLVYRSPNSSNSDKQTS